MPRTIYTIVPIAYEYNDEHSYPENYSLPEDAFTCRTAAKKYLDEANKQARLDNEEDCRNEDNEPYTEFYKLIEVTLHD